MQNTADPIRIQFTSAPTWNGVCDFAEGPGEREKHDGGEKTDHAKAADGAEASRRFFYKDTIERPAKAGGECNGEADQRHVARLEAGLEPEDPDCAEQPEQRAELELPLPNDPAFLREKDEREQRGHDDRRTNENGINARPHVVEGGDLRDLVDNIGHCRQEADADYIPVEPRTAASKAIECEREDGEKGDRVAIKVLRERLVVAEEVKLEE